MKLPWLGQRRIAIAEDPRRGFRVESHMRGLLRWRAEQTSPWVCTFEECILLLADMNLAALQKRGSAPGRKQRRRFAKQVLQRSGLR